METTWLKGSLGLSSDHLFDPFQTGVDLSLVLGDGFIELTRGGLGRPAGDFFTGRLGPGRGGILLFPGLFHQLEHRLHTPGIRLGHPSECPPGP